MAKKVIGEKRRERERESDKMGRISWKFIKITCTHVYNTDICNIYTASIYM